MSKFWLIILFLPALFLRLFRLGDFPAGFTPDEAAQGYSAYSILKTGRDEWGVKLPLNPRSFGDFKPPLYTYLTIPSVAVFGLNEFAVRLPNAILGSLAVIVVYFLVRELFGAGPLARVSALLLAVSPWHIGLSRGAFEANLTTFFLPAGILFFFAGMRKSWLLAPAALLFGLNLFTYHSAKLITPAVVACLLFWQGKKLWKGLGQGRVLAIFSAVIFLALACLTFWSFKQGAGTRAADISIFSGGREALALERHFAVLRGLPDFVSRIFNNKVGFIAGEFSRNYFSYLSWQFLFTQGAGEATYGLRPGKGLLYLWELPFLLYALYLTGKKKNGQLLFLCFWLLVSPLPASLARGVGFHANRAAVMMPAIQILSAYGLVAILLLIRNRVVKLAMVFLFTLAFVTFVEDYFIQAPLINAPRMFYGWRQVLSTVNIREYRKIVVSRRLSEPQAYIMFYTRMDPKLVQRQTADWKRYEAQGLLFVDQLGTYHLNNFEFRDFAFPEDWELKNVLLVGWEEDFLLQNKAISENIALGKIRQKRLFYYPDGKIAFVLVSL